MSSIVQAIRSTFLCAAGLLLLTAGSSAEDGADWYREQRVLFGGMPVQVCFAPRDEALAARAWASLADYDAIANDWRDDSEIGRINACGVGAYRLSPGLTELFELADGMRQATDGAFDITVGPLRRLWKGAATTGIWPDEAQLAALRASIGPATYRRDGSALEVLKPGVKFDFGGIKGHAIDRVTALLRQAGCRAALVQISGETCCWGLSPRGAPHRLGIPDPDAPDDPERMLIRLQDQGEGLSGSTSGNYRQPIVIGGRTVYHIYDPRTGLPVDTQVLSVSVLFPGSGHNGMADAFTKAGAVLGLAGLPLIEKAGGQGLILLRRADGAVESHATAGWARFIMPNEGRP
jgi:thiamine biosynthesis lipoprotein